MLPEECANTLQPLTLSSAAALPLCTQSSLMYPISHFFPLQRLQEKGRERERERGRGKCGRVGEGQGVPHITLEDGLPE